MPDALESDLHTLLRMQNLDENMLNLLNHVQSFSFVNKHFEELLQEHVVEPVFDDTFVRQFDKSFLQGIT